jgi:hypothetical protein
MNRREMFAALAATAVAGDVLAFAQNVPGTMPAAAPAAGTTPAPSAAPSAAPAADATPAPAAVMGSKVFDWNLMVDKPNKTGSVRTV